MTAGAHYPRRDAPQGDRSRSSRASSTFLLNNYALLGFMLFVLVATTFPMISEAFWDEEVTVGPPYYNAWVQPMGLTIFSLMGIGTLLGWKKTSPGLLRQAPSPVPLIASGMGIVLRRRAGGVRPRARLPVGRVDQEAIYGGALGQGLRVFNAFTPGIGVALCAFNSAVIVQEFAVMLLSRTREESGADRRCPPCSGFSGLLARVSPTRSSRSRAHRGVALRR